MRWTRGSGSSAATRCGRRRSCGTGCGASGRSRGWSGPSRRRPPTGSWAGSARSWRSRSAPAVRARPVAEPGARAVSQWSNSPTPPAAPRTRSRPISPAGRSRPARSWTPSRPSKVATGSSSVVHGSAPRQGPMRRTCSSAVSYLRALSRYRAGRCRSRCTRRSSSGTRSDDRATLSSRSSAAREDGSAERPKRRVRSRSACRWIPASGLPAGTSRRARSANAVISLRLPARHAPTCPPAAAAGRDRSGGRPSWSP